MCGCTSRDYTEDPVRPRSVAHAKIESVEAPLPNQHSGTNSPKLWVWSVAQVQLELRATCHT